MGLTPELRKAIEEKAKVRELYGDHFVNYVKGAEACFEIMQDSAIGLMRDDHINTLTITNLKAENQRLREILRDLIFTEGNFSDGNEHWDRARAALKGEAT